MNKDKSYDLADGFLRNVFEEIKSQKIEILNLQIDHICYRVETQEEYNSMKEFLKTIGTQISANIINGREISNFILNEPIKYNNYSIEVFELPSPKEGSRYKSGYEHCEFVLNDLSFDDFIKINSQINFTTKDRAKERNPDIAIKLQDNLTIKFHPKSLKEVIENDFKTGFDSPIKN